MLLSPIHQIDSVDIVNTFIVHLAAVVVVIGKTTL